MNEQELERKIQDKNLNAPRLTPDYIDSCIVNEDYYVFPNTTFMVCLLTLKNGFKISGESNCVSPENFNEEIGKDIAKKNAREKIWLLEGYLLKDKLKGGLV